MKDGVDLGQVMGRSGGGYDKNAFYICVRLSNNSLKYYIKTFSEFTKWSLEEKVMGDRREAGGNEWM